MSHAFFPGTFDPVTLGHTHIIERVAKLFDEVTVGVALSASKNTWFTQEERVALIEHEIQVLPNVKVIAYEGLTMHAAEHLGAHAIVRGVRNAADSNFEQQMAHAHHALNASIDTLWLPPHPNCSFISASLVRDIAASGGALTAFVSSNVAAALQEKHTSTHD